MASPAAAPPVIVGTGTAYQSREVRDQRVLIDRLCHHDGFRRRRARAGVYQYRPAAVVRLHAHRHRASLALVALVESGSCSRGYRNHGDLARTIHL